MGLAEGVMAAAAIIGAGTSVYSATQKPSVPKATKSATVLQNQTPATVSDEDDVQVGSSRSDARKGRKNSRQQLLAPQTPKGAGTGLSV